jgi:hypothetical protein
MDLLWLMVRMIAYGLIVGLVIGIGAFCYAFISIRFAEGSVEKWGQRTGEFTLLPTCNDKKRQ